MSSTAGQPEPSAQQQGGDRPPAAAHPTVPPAGAPHAPSAHAPSPSAPLRHAQPSYAPAPYGSAPYGSAPYGSAPYGSGPYAAAPYAAAPYAAPPTLWTAPTHPGPKTSTMALLAILAAVAGTSILLGIGSIAAIVLGLIALGQIRRTGDDGRLLALWAVILGGITLLALIVLTATGIAGIALLVEQLQGAGI